MHTKGLAQLAAAAATALEADALLDVALPVVLEVSGATTVLVCDADGADLVVRRQLSAPLPERGPDAWRGCGADGIESHPLPGGHGLLVVVSRAGDAVASPEASSAAVDILLAGLCRLTGAAELVDLQARVDNAQHLAGMGDYEWHIPSDTVQWSDELFRIYGHQPQSFVPSYDLFLSLIHPSDRARIQGVHQRAYETGEPYSMLERVVRPDGSVRYLSSNGEVLRGADGTPERMRGTCLDVTERVQAERERERSSARLRGLVDASPRTILLVDRAGTIVDANPSAHDMLAGDPVGHRLDEVLPGRQGGLGLLARRLDGGTVWVDLSTAMLPHGDDEQEELEALFLDEAAQREEREALTARLSEARLRRRQALEINDNVVQGLVAAKLALDDEQYPVVAGYIDQTLTAARSMMNDLLEPLDGEDLAPGDLVRSAPATITRPQEQPAPPAPEDPPGGQRVLLVDDADEIRLLTRTYLERVGLDVVGEAGDGLAGVEQARALQPDLVVLDMAMPQMDGLEALPRIKAAVPGVRVVVFSGFDESVLAEQAVAAGADAYAVKGGSMRDLVDVVSSMLQVG